MAPTNAGETANARAIRLDTQRVQLGRSDGMLLNVSATGALVRIPNRLAIDSEVAFAIFTDGQPVHVRSRVVRCVETPVSLAGATWKHTEFEIAIVFDEQSDALGNVFNLMSRPSRPA